MLTLKMISLFVLDVRNVIIVTRYNDPMLALRSGQARSGHGHRLEVGRVGSCQQDVVHR